MDSLTQDNKPLQLPNVVREAFLGINEAKTSILLDLLYTLGYKPGQWVTYQECLNVASEYTAQNIIYYGLRSFTIKRDKLPTIKPGPPTYKYQIPSLDALRNDLTVETSYVSDPLELEDFKSAKNYRKALHREMIRRGYEDNDHLPVVFSRKLMAERLNVSPDTLRNYEKDLGTYVEPRFDSKLLQHKFELTILPKRKSHDGRYLAIQLQGRTIKRLPCIASLAGLYMKKGYDVFVGWRTCNAYAPYSPHSAQAMRDRHGEWADIINS